MQQYIISCVWIILTSCLSYLALPAIGYKSVALLLLFAVSILAMVFRIRAVLLAATISALIWDFFFIPPVFTFSIGSTDDKLILIMYFVVAMVSAVLSRKIKAIEETERQKQEKENTIKLYNTILNSLSHELRTPISTIIAAADNMQEENSPLTNETKQELLNQISKAAIRLNRQVENLLNMSRLESGSLHLKLDWCDVNELIYESIAHTKDLAANHKLSLHLSQNLPMCRIDRGLIAQAINNLLQNAFTHATANAEIEVTTKMLDNQLLIVIEDNGLGLPENEIQKVFDKFYRLNNSKTGGTGLGLSIVKGYVEAHKGTVNLNNKAKGGARFAIRIPCQIQSFEAINHE